MELVAKEADAVVARCEAEVERLQLKGRMTPQLVPEVEVTRVQRKLEAAKKVAVAAKANLEAIMEAGKPKSSKE